MSRYRLLPTPAQEAALRNHCAQARYVWNLSVEQQSWWRPGRASAPGYLEQCRQLTAARAEHEWLRAGSQMVQQQALRDFAQAMANFFAGTHRKPTWRKAGRDEGFRIVAGLQRRLARARRGSARRVRVKLAVARLRARETDARKDWAEKTSTDLARRFDLIRIEDLRVADMTRSAKGTRAEPGRNVHVDGKSRESQAGFQCTACGFACHADVNAARNIAAGHAVTARGRSGLPGRANREPQLALLPT